MALNLFSSFVVPGVPHVTLYPDDQDDRLYYMLQEFPTIMKAPDGGPMFNMIVFARDFNLFKDLAGNLSQTETEGGLVSFTTDMSVSQQDQTKIRNYLQAPQRLLRLMYRGPGKFQFAPFQQHSDARPVKLSYPTWIDGTVQLSLIPSAGETWVKSTAGSEKPSLIGANMANYTALLGQEGVRLVRSMLDKGLTPGSVNYKVSFMARIPSMSVDVTGNMSDVYTEVKKHCTVHEHMGNRYFVYPQVSSLEEMRTKFASLQINVKTVDMPSGIDQTLATQVQTKLNEMAFAVIQTYLTNLFTSTAFTPGVKAEQLGSTFDHTMENPPAGNQLWLKDFKQGVTGTIDFHVSYEKMLPVEKSPNASLVATTPAAELKKRIVEADLSQPYFTILDVPVQVAADFERDPIAAIKVMCDYKQKDDITGQTKAKSAEYVFTEGSEKFRFQTVMAKNRDGTPKDEYTYRSQIIYKASSRREDAPPVQTRDKSLFLSYDKLSCVSVQAQWGAIPIDTVDKVLIEFNYPGLNAPTARKEVFLSNDHTTDSWFTYTGGNPSTEYEYKLSFFMKDGQRIDEPIKRDTRGTLVVNAPFEDLLRATFIPQGSFPPMASIVVSTRYTDETADYVAHDVHSFTDLTDTWTWEVMLRDREKRGFEYRVDVTYSDGSSVPGEWRAATEGTILVGDVARQMLEIEVVPALLDLDATWKLVIVRLNYSDPENQVSQSHTFQIKAGALNGELKWKVALKDPSKKNYTYQIQAFAFDSTRNKVVGPHETSDPLLVLDPDSWA